MIACAQSHALAETQKHYAAIQRSGFAAKFQSDVVSDSSFGAKSARAAVAGGWRVACSCLA